MKFQVHFIFVFKNYQHFSAHQQCLLINSFIKLTTKLKIHFYFTVLIICPKTEQEATCALAKAKEKVKKSDPE